MANPFEQDICPACGGTDDECIRCDGVGWVYTEDAREARRLLYEQERDMDKLLSPDPARLKVLRLMRYQDYLLSPEWKARRAMHVRMANFTCDRCKKRDRNYFAFNVHHKNYKRLGCEDLFDLEVLCVACHKKAHGIAA